MRVSTPTPMGPSEPVVSIGALASREVPPNGPKTAAIALVGEAPGKDEASYGAPFVGASGELLCQMLAQAGLSRRILKRFDPQIGLKVEVSSQVYTTNVIRYWPPGDFGKLFYRDSKQTVPTEELTASIERLRRELSETSARVIIAVGEHALRALTGKRAITKWRGSVLECTLIPGRKVIPMIHPAAVLREYGFRPFCVFDLKRAKAEAEFPEIRRPNRTFIIAPTLEQVCEAEERLCAAEWVSCDIETKYNNIACIGFADSAEWAICIPFIAQAFHYWGSLELETRIWRAVHRILGSPAKKIFQNGLFDISHLTTHYVKVHNFAYDTMLAQNALYAELPKGLDVLASIYTTQPYYKDTGKAVIKGKYDEKGWQGEQLDRDLWTYNCTDAVVTYEVAMEQLKDFKEMGGRIR